MSDPTPDELLRDPERLASVSTRTKAALRRSLEPFGVRVEAVEADLRAYVRAMKNEGRPPEAVVIAVKDLLSERSVPLGLAAQAAFEQARDNGALAEAIVSLAIALYFDVGPEPTATPERG